MGSLREVRDGLERRSRAASEMADRVNRSECVSGALWFLYIGSEFVFYERGSLNSVPMEWADRPNDRVYETWRTP